MWRHARVPVSTGKLNMLYKHDVTFLLITSGESVRLMRLPSAGSDLLILDVPSVRDITRAPSFTMRACKTQTKSSPKGKATGTLGVFEWKKRLSNALTLLPLYVALKIFCVRVWLKTALSLILSQLGSCSPYSVLISGVTSSVNTAHTHRKPGSPHQLRLFVLYAL